MLPQPLRTVDDPCRSARSGPRVPHIPRFPSEPHESPELSPCSSQLTGAGTTSDLTQTRAEEGPMSVALEEKLRRQRKLTATAMVIAAAGLVVGFVAFNAPAPPVVKPPSPSTVTIGDQLRQRPRLPPQRPPIVPDVPRTPDPWIVGDPNPPDTPLPDGPGPDAPVRPGPEPLSLVECVWGETAHCDAS